MSVSELSKDTISRSWTAPFPTSIWARLFAWRWQCLNWICWNRDTSGLQLKKQKAYLILGHFSILPPRTATGPLPTKDNKMAFPTRNESKRSGTHWGTRSGWYALSFNSFLVNVQRVVGISSQISLIQNANCGYATVIGAAWPTSCE